MSFVASASGVVKASRGDCFSRLRDFPGWRSWMPRSFRPLRGPARPLEAGDRVLLLIAPAPRSLPLLISVTLVRVEADREITWRGGIPGLLVGEHAFFFEDTEGGATLVRSEETWSGAVTGIELAAKRIRASASRVGREQIDALARAVEKPA
jgi:hypothetical protein